jgi:hypothetical protein
MDTKQLYNEKCLTLAAVSGLIDRIRGELANLSTIEDRFPAPDHGDLYGLNVALDELEAQVDGVASAVKVLAE